MNTTGIKTIRDSCLRAAAQRRGYVLVKRRDRMNTPGIGKGYMILDQYSGEIMAGQRFELTPEEVREFLNEHYTEEKSWNIK